MDYTKRIQAQNNQSCYELAKWTSYYLYFVTNFIWPYLHQFFNNSHSLNGYEKPSKRPFDQYQLHLEAISIG